MKEFNKQIKKLFKWSLKTSMNNYPDTIFSLQQLQEILCKVWNEMVEDGDIEIIEK